MWPQLKPEQGQALVETALALPLLVLIFLGTIEFVHWSIAQVVVKEAAFEAGREAVLHGDDRNAATRVAQKICSSVSSGKTTFLIEHADQPALKRYVVIHHLKLIFPIWPVPSISQAVPAFLFDTGT